jgi:uncharacterized protein YbjT (DUF2867 family)
MKVLLTGSTGYIGKRLKNKLLKNENIQLRLLVRNKRTIPYKISSKVEIIEGDTFKIDSLKEALKDIDVAFYLIHSMRNENYKDLDKISAQNFLNVAKQCGVKKIIYLGGLGVKNSETSDHLLSRIETGEILSSSKDVSCVWIRAGVIIGSGSASFEIIRNLVEKLPIMTTPKWVNTMAQPISVDDVLLYLEHSLYLDIKENIVVDIGCEKLPYKEMMLQCADVLNLKRTLIPLPFLSINLSSYWLNLFTPVPFSIAKELVLGLKSEVIKQNNNAEKYFPDIKPLSYKDALSNTLKEIETNQIISRWNDNGAGIWDIVHTDEINDAIFLDRKERVLKNLTKENIFKTFTQVGGKNGWFAYDWLWSIRGIIDRIFGGEGLNRGRNDPYNVHVGDTIDFWKVVDVQENERLLLYAKMKLPGKAWLEFKIIDNKLIQSAYFYPKGLLGRIYWYSLIPIHYFMFNKMADGIIKKAESTYLNKLTIV